MALATRKFIWIVTISRNPKKQAKNPASHSTQILASPASRRAVKSRIPSRCPLFSRFPNCTLVKSQIPKIPFQTLCGANGSSALGVISWVRQRECSTFLTNSCEKCSKFAEKETYSWLQLDAEVIVVREGEILLGLHSNLVKQETGHTRGSSPKLCIVMKCYELCLY